MQEIRRAGRSGRKSSAVMYYNNSDIARNKDNIDASIREYCTSATVCLRKILLNYFGFETVNQEECCVICNGSLIESSQMNVLIYFMRKPRRLLRHTGMM